MRDPTGVLVAQPQILEDACSWLGSFRPEAQTPRELLERVLRVFVARVTGAPVHPSTLQSLHVEFDVEDRREAVDAVVAVLKNRRLLDDGLELQALALRQLVVPEASQAEVTPARGEVRGPHPFDLPRTGVLDDGPRPTLVSALSEFVGPRSVKSVEGAQLVPVGAVLRARALTAAAAGGLGDAAEHALLQDDLIRLPSTPDEALLGATEPPARAVPKLVRAAQAILLAAPAAQREALSFGLAALEHGPGLASDDDPAFVEAVWRAGQEAARGGLVALDEHAWAAGRGELAEHPAHKRHVDPEAAFGHDRWELSAFVQRPGFIGREDLVAELAADLGGRSLEEEERARLVLLHGPAGMGKTSALRQALRRAGLDDDTAPVLWGAADPLQPTPYASIAGMVRALAGAPAGDPLARAHLSRLLKGIAEYLDDEDSAELLSLEPILAYLIGAAAADDDDEEIGQDVDLLSPRALRVAMRRAVLLVVRGLGRRAGDRPAVVVIPGAEAIDAPTQELLAFLGRRQGRRVVFVLISTAKLRLPKRFREGFDLVTREVQPLSAEEALLVVSGLLDEEVSADDAGSFVEKARGNPLALAHLVRFAIEGGLVRRAEGRWDLSGVKTRTLPGSLDRILAGRLERLPVAQRRTLGFCAALGHTFMPAAAEIVGVRLGMAREEIGRVLNLLLQTGFLMRSRRRPGAPVFRDAATRAADPMLAFEHPLLRAASEAAISDDERPRVHELVAEALETLLPSGTRAVAAALARHLREAGVRDGALEYLTLATRRAVRLNNADGAIQMAQQGLALCREHEVGSRFVFQLELEKALEQAGDRDAQKDALKDLVRLAEATGEPKRQGQALFRVARFNVFSGDHDKAEQVALKALERFRQASDERGQAQTLRVLALARFERRDPEGAVDALTAGRELVAFDDHQALGILEHQLGLMRLEAGDAVGALEHLVAARDHKRRTGDPAGEGAILDAIADAFLRAGRLHTARDVLEKAVALRARIGDEAGRAESSKNLAEVSLLCGQTEQALELAGAARDLARALSLERLERTATTLAARAHLQARDAKAAEQVIDNVRRRVDDQRDPFAAMEAALVSAQAKWARALAAKGNAARERLLKSALERAKAATDLGESHGYATGQVLGMALRGAVLHELGDTPAALLYSQRAFELFDDRAQTALPSEDIVLTHARVLASLGDTEDARALLDRAVGLLEERAERLPEALKQTFWSVPARAEVLAYKKELGPPAG